MEFISLHTVLNGIANNIKPLSYTAEEIKFKDSAPYIEFWRNAYPEMDRERRLSEAARDLNMALQRSTNPPQWWAYDDEQGFSVEDESVAPEGMELLKKATTLSNRKQDARAQHISDCMERDWDPNVIEMAFDMDATWPPRQSFFRDHQIGFELGAITKLLELKKIKHSPFINPFSMSQRVAFADTGPEGIIAWWDGAMNASVHFKRVAVTPNHAAMLLCQLDPLDKKNPNCIDPEGHSNDQTGAGEFNALLYAFEDLERAQPQNRTLQDWVCIAQRENRKYHDWIDDYLLALDVLKVPTAAEPRLTEQKSVMAVTKHRLKSRAPAILTAEINQAKEIALNPQDAQCIWGELCKLAESKTGVMIGYSSDGVQYRGKKYQKDGVPDVFTLQNLRHRIKRESARESVKPR